MKVDKSIIDEIILTLQYESFYPEGTTTTLCAAILPDGHVVAVGQSGCIDPTEYSKDTGDKVAYQNALALATNELWKLKGWELRDTLRKSKEL